MRAKKFTMYSREVTAFLIRSVLTKYWPATPKHQRFQRKSLIPKQKPAKGENKIKSLRQRFNYRIMNAFF